MSKTKNRSGFTIIEVVLVLAIAGLIFMMVFLALPALQRSQRDTQRQQDIARMETAIVNYQSNNRGKVPTGTGNFKGVDEKKQCDSNVVTSNMEEWCKFYMNYLLVGSGGSTDTFSDPDGEPYSLYVTNCDATATSQPCKVQRADSDFDKQSEGGDMTAYGGGTDVPNHAIVVNVKAVCDGEKAVQSTGTRKLALLYKKEGGGSICINN